MPDTPNALPDRDMDDDGVLDFPTAATVQSAANLLPAADTRPLVTMYWADPGRLRTSEEDHPGDDLLVIDVANKTFVINQADPESDGNPTGPHMYKWDSVDSFSVGGTDVPMALFETILETSQSDDSKIDSDDHHPVVDELRLRPALGPSQLGAHRHLRPAGSRLSHRI